MQTEALVLATARNPNDALYLSLQEKFASSADGMPQTLARIGDCEAPAIIAAAVYSGHRYARELEEEVDRVFFEETC